MVKKSAKSRAWVILSTVVVLAVAGVFIFSPYGSKPGFGYKLVSSEITIQAPASFVFKYLGNSANAGRWSTFVNHITLLNPGKYPDGAPGSTRRCYCNANKTGTRWDELITEVVPAKKRQLIIYNMREFPMTAEGLATEQLYDSTGKTTTRLTFTLFFKNHEPSLSETIKMHLAAYRIDQVYKANLMNIQRETERIYQSQNSTDKL